MRKRGENNEAVRQRRRKGLENRDKEKEIRETEEKEYLD